jgi:DNA polymerase III delta prime subunit
MELSHLEKNIPLHHAYCVFGNAQQAQAGIERVLEKRGIKIHQNPDYISIKYSVFGIDDARWIKNHQCRRNVSNAQIFILHVLTFTHEAQNALLKTFEEPSEDTHFFVIVPNENVLLSTLRSRMTVIETRRLNRTNSNQLIYDFFKLSAGDRIQRLSSTIDSHDKEKALEFLDDLETGLHNNITSSKKETKGVNILHAIYKARGLIEGGRGNIKLLLENIALTL